MEKEGRARPGGNKRRTVLIVLICLAVLIPAGILLAVQGGSPREMTEKMVAKKLDTLCGKFSSGTWTDGGGSLEFAGYLGGQLFGQRDVYTEWEKLDAIPQIKARGLRAGDIICGGNHGAVVRSVSEGGEIRVVECDDEGEKRIRKDCFFLDDPKNATFTRMVEQDRVDCVYYAPNNTSPVLWSAVLDGLPEEPEISGETYPTVLSNDQSFGLRGKILCKYPMSEIRGIVTNRVTGERIFDVAVQPHDTIYYIGNPVSETINDQLVFNSPECSNSWLNYSVVVQYEKEGETLKKVVLDRNFKVGTPREEEPD